MINIELYEATGSSPDTGIVDNLNWKSISGVDATYPYYLHPITRPYFWGNGDARNDSALYACSEVKYNYAIISGTYSAAKRVRWVISGPTDLDTNLYYQITNTYTIPTNLLMTGTFINNSTTLYPGLSTSGPSSASQIINLTPNTTYYTNYLVTQLYVKRGAWNEVGNTTEITISLLVDDYE